MKIGMSWRGTGCFDWRNVHYTHITRKSKVFRNYATTYTIILPTTHQNRILGHVTQKPPHGRGCSANYNIEFTVCGNELRKSRILENIKKGVCLFF